jgi:hypothetical protein
MPLREDLGGGLSLRCNIDECLGEEFQGAFGNWLDTRVPRPYRDHTFDECGQFLTLSCTPFVLSFVPNLLNWIVGTQSAVDKFPSTWTDLNGLEEARRRRCCPGGLAYGCWNVVQDVTGSVGSYEDCA